MSLLAVSTPAITAAAVVGALVLIVVLFRLTWRVAEPNEALIVSGMGAGSGAEAPFRVVVGKGAVVLPGFQTVRRLPLGIREAALEIQECVTSQGIPVGVQGVVLFKVGDDLASISNAARRFLEMRDEAINGQVHAVFEGHLRSIIGSLTVEEMINNRDRLRQETLESSGDEMGRLGLVVDAQIREIVDPTGYIQNLAAPHAAEMQKRRGSHRRSPTRRRHSASRRRRPSRPRRRRTARGRAPRAAAPGRGGEAGRGAGVRDPEAGRGGARRGDRTRPGGMPSESSSRAPP